VSVGNYKFGTKAFNAKLTNGVLLLRVGGGYVGIQEFFDLYEECELQKQIRNEAKKLANDENVQEESSSPNMKK